MAEIRLTLSEANPSQIAVEAVASGTCGDKEDVYLLKNSSGENFNSGLGVPSVVLFIVGEIVGSGLLAIGNSVVNAGAVGIALVVMASLLNLTAAAVISWCYNHVVKTNPELKFDNRRAYSNIIRVGIGQRTAHLATVVFYVCSMIATTVFLLVSADLLSVFLKSVTAQPWIHNVRLWVALYACFLCPMTLFGTPKEFWAIALIAVVTTSLSAAFVVSKILCDYASGIYVVAAKRNVTTQSFFSSVGVILFAFCGVPFFPNIQADMKRPTSFCKASSLSYLIILLFYLPLGVISYVVLGDRTAKNILQNVMLPSDRGLERVLPYGSFVLLSFHFVFAFVLMFNPLAQEVEGALKIPQKFCWQRCCVRISMLLIVLVLAEAVPDFNMLMSICGGVMLSLLSFVLPFCCYWRLNSDVPRWQTVGLAVTLFLVFVCACGSFYSAVNDIVLLYS